MYGVVAAAAMTEKKKRGLTHRSLVASDDHVAFHLRTFHTGTFCIPSSPCCTAELAYGLSSSYHVKFLSNYLFRTSMVGLNGPAVSF